MCIIWLYIIHDGYTIYRAGFARRVGRSPTRYGDHVFNYVILNSEPGSGLRCRFQKLCLMPRETTDGEAPMPLTVLAAEVLWLKP